MATRRKTVPVLLLAGLLLAALAAAGGCGASSEELQRAQAARDKAEGKLAEAQQSIVDLKGKVADLQARVESLKKTAKASAPTPTPTPSGTVYTPAQGTAERQAILDAARAGLGWSHLFIVHRLKVKDGWAYALLEGYNPEEPDSKTDPVTVLMKRSDEDWKALYAGTGAGSDAEPGTTSLTQYLRDKYPAAPAAIFP